MLLRCTLFFVCLEHFLNICVRYPSEHYALRAYGLKMHSVESVQIRSFFGPNTGNTNPYQRAFFNVMVTAWKVSKYGVIWSRSLIKSVGFFLLSVILSLIWSNFIICDCSLFACIFNSIVDCVSAVLHCLPTICFDSAFVIFTEFSHSLGAISFRIGRPKPP